MTALGQVHEPEKDFRDLTLTAALRRAVETSPQHPAIRDSARELTYQQLWDAAAALAGGLAEAGVSEGARVLTMLDNSVDYGVVVTAINFLGAVVVPVNTMHKGTLLEHVIRSSEAVRVIVEARYLETVTAADPNVLVSIIVRGALPHAQKIAGSTPVVSFLSVAAGAPVIPVERFVWDPLAIGYTSGTTGLSKGVVLSNGYLMTVSDPTEVQRVIGEDQVFYVVCPMFHQTGLAGGFFCAVSAGGTTSIAPRFSASTFAKDATTAGATATTLVGTMADFILRQPEQPDDADCSLRTVVMVPLHPRVDEFTSRFNVDVRTSYGSSESGTILVADDLEAITRRSCGKPRAGFEVKLVDEHDMDVQDDTIGEVVARSDRPWLICGEYLGNPEASASAWRNGWFHTGDLLTRDTDGYFYFVDRKKDAIRHRGENVSSVEVEREVVAHEDVIECAAVAVEAEHMEQDVKVFVTRRPGSALTETELTLFLIDRMPRYSVPRYIQFIDELPRTATGKVRKELLRAQFNTDVWDRESAGITIPR